VKIESEVRKLDPAFFGTDLQRRSALFSWTSVDTNKEIVLRDIAQRRLEPILPMSVQRCQISRCNIPKREEIYPITTKCTKLL
jgi:hypothetical protein